LAREAAPAPAPASLQPPFARSVRCRRDALTRRSARKRLHAASTLLVHHHSGHPDPERFTPKKLSMELQIRGVPRTYSNSVQALKDVSLTILAGMYGLLRPSGAGRSTLRRIIATLPGAGFRRLSDTR
jgi:ABC-type glutathione transport system ATPase component